MADKDKNKSGDFYTRPEKLGAWDGCKQFCWNPDTSQFMGRTSGSWGRILLFYLIFYAVLSAFFMTLWFLFQTTLLDGRPKYELGESIIGQNPGLGFRPMPPESNVESTLIWYQKHNPNNTKYWVEELNRFLGEFKQKSNKTVNCRVKAPGEDESCKVDLSVFDPCTSMNEFDYEEGRPCIFLKLNKIYNWNPDYYTTKDQLPQKMPASLKAHIASRNTSDERLRHVWVSCEGENPADVENLGFGVAGQVPVIKYMSLDNEQGFNGRYFPYKNTDGYLQPLVAVQFASIKAGVLINIECKAWAKNIEHDRQDRRGSVHFELMIDNAKKDKEN